MPALQESITPSKKIWRFDLDGEDISTRPFRTLPIVAASSSRVELTLPDIEHPFTQPMLNFLNCYARGHLGIEIEKTKDLLCAAGGLAHWSAASVFYYSDRDHFPTDGYVDLVDFLRSKCGALRQRMQDRLQSIVQQPLDLLWIVECCSFLESMSALLVTLRNDAKWDPEAPFSASDGSMPYCLQFLWYPFPCLLSMHVNAPTCTVALFVGFRFGNHFVPTFDNGRVDLQLLESLEQSEKKHARAAQALNKADAVAGRPFTLDDNCLAHFSLKFMCPMQLSALNAQASLCLHFGGREVWISSLSSPPFVVCAHHGSVSSSEVKLFRTLYGGCMPLAHFVNVLLRLFVRNMCPAGNPFSDKRAGSDESRIRRIDVEQFECVVSDVLMRLDMLEERDNKKTVNVLKIKEFWPWFGQYLKLMRSTSLMGPWKNGEVADLMTRNFAELTLNGVPGRFLVRYGSTGSMAMILSFVDSRGACRHHLLQYYLSSGNKTKTLGSVLDELPTGDQYRLSEILNLSSGSPEWSVPSWRKHH